MRKRCWAAAALLEVWIGLWSPAFAHAPYFRQREAIDHQTFGGVEFAVLYGDGVIGPDPARVVVIDKDGRLLAASPLSDALVLRCDRARGASACGAYDAARGLIYQPNDADWVRGIPIANGDRPLRNAYPEYLEIEYGFDHRTADFFERMSFQFAVIWRAPASTALFIAWWSVAFAFLARRIWVTQRNGWRRPPFRAWGVFWWFISLAIFVGMGSLAQLYWLFAPHYPVMFLFSLASGAAIAAMATRPRARVAGD